jgi:hypothetical protein
MEDKITRAIFEVKVGRDLSLKHLLQVDDVLLFLKELVKDTKN